MPRIFLDDQKIEYVDKYKNLGCIIFDSLNDDGHMQRQVLHLTVRCIASEFWGVRKFGKCSKEVKV